MALCVKSVQAFTVTQQSRPSARRHIKPVAIAAPLSSVKEASNGGGPHRVLAIQATLEDINKSLAACIKQAANMNSLDKINKGIGKEISRAAVGRYRE